MLPKSGGGGGEEEEEEGGVGGFCVLLHGKQKKVSLVVDLHCLLCYIAALQVNSSTLFKKINCNK